MLTFATESDAAQSLLDLLAASPHIHLLDQVHLRHPHNARLLRIDRLAIIQGFRAPGERTLVGIETKCRYEHFREWSAALKQAIDYRHATIDDKRATHTQGQRLEYVFLFPDLRDVTDLAEHRWEWPLWAAGVERMVGQFNVGTIRRLRDEDGQFFLRFYCSADPLWDTRYGAWRSEAWGTARRPGAR